MKMKMNDFTRWKFIATVSAGSVAGVVSNVIPTFGNITKMNGNSDKFSIPGGTPVTPGKVCPIDHMLIRFFKKKITKNYYLKKLRYEKSDFKIMCSFCNSSCVTNVY
jgi:hypothetical protein